MSKDAYEDRAMIEGYTTIQEVAQKWGLTPRRIQVMCVSGKIKGATKFGRAWAIPSDTERPVDGRITTGEYRDWRKNSTKRME